MTEFQRTSYVLVDPAGGFWHTVPRGCSTYRVERWAADSPDGPELLTDSDSNPKWLWSADRIEQVCVVRTATPVLIAWELRPALGETADNPRRLTAEEGQARWEAEDESFAALYERVTEPGVPVVEFYPVAVDELKGAPWPVTAAGTGLSWSVDTATALRQTSAFHHLFPGTLAGVRGAIAKQLDSLPGSTVHDYSEWRVSKRFMDPPKPKPKRGSGSRTEPKRTWRTVGVPVPKPPNTISAPNRAEAVAKYEALRDQAIAIFEGWHECPTCQGRGFFGGAA